MEPSHERENPISDILNDEPERALLSGTGELRNGIVQFAFGVVRQEPELAALACTLSKRFCQCSRNSPAHSA